MGLSTSAWFYTLNNQRRISLRHKGTNDIKKGVVCGRFSNHANSTKYDYDQYDEYDEYNDYDEYVIIKQSRIFEYRVLEYLCIIKPDYLEYGRPAKYKKRRSAKSKTSVLQFFNYVNS